MRFVLSMVFVLVAACSGAADVRGEPPEEETVVVLEAPEAATEMCSGHVSGNVGHIQWTAYTSPESVNAQLELLRGRFGPESERILETEGTLREEYVWRDDEDAPTRVLTLTFAGAQGPWWECELPQGTASVLMLSTMTRIP